MIDGYRSLEELRSEINSKAQMVGVRGCNAANSDFRYDELARQLKVRQLNALNRETLLQLCREEGLLVEQVPAADPFLSIAIRSFLGPAADIVGAAPKDTLFLIDDFGSVICKLTANGSGTSAQRSRPFYEPQSRNLPSCG